MVFYFLAAACFIPMVFCVIKFRNSHDRYMKARNYGIPDILGLLPKPEGRPPFPLPTIIWFSLIWVSMFVMIAFVAVARQS
jgi:hypothetical protein